MSKDFTSVLAATGIEELLTKPDRARDDVDGLAVRKHKCPVCNAWPSSPCSWSLLASAPDWAAHPSRRALVDDVDWLCRNIIGRDVDRALAKLERRGLARFGLLRRQRNSSR